MRFYWRSFIPRHVLLDLYRHPRRNPVGHEQRFNVVALFADVSGFTAISEALASFGNQGTEELTTILNSYFEPMIELIESFGGIIGKFGGDAMTVLFPYDKADQHNVVRRAIQCAVLMQADMERYRDMPTRAGTFSLAMKAGIALGSVLCLNVGDPAIRLEYIIAGKVLDDCADAEHHANKGEIVVSMALLPFAPDATIVEQRGDFVCVSRLNEPVDRAPLSPTNPPSKHIANRIATFLHPALAARIRAHQLNFINEHRRVVVMFVRFGGFDYDHDPNVGEQLQQYAAAMIRIIHKYDGYLNKIDMGDKGSKYIVLFGAPVAHENDAERALRCALELRDLAPTTTHIGINAGVVFCGQVGSKLRQEYTVMGDPVNLAARLMQAAQSGQILASAAVQHGTKTFEWHELVPIMVKGKTEPIHISALLNLHQQTIGSSEPSYSLPMIGRVAERERANKYLRRMQNGRGMIIGVTAEAGMGKSRLSAVIADDASTMQIAVYGGACQSFGSQTAYLVWHTLWRSFFDVADTSIDQAVRQLSAFIEPINPRLVGQIPLLGAVLNLPIPDNDTTIALEGQLRVDLLKALLLTCLQHQSHIQPMLFVLEDVHWIDPLSLELLEFLARNLAQLPLAMLLLYRPLDDSQSSLARLMQRSNAREIALHELDQHETNQLIQSKLQHLGYDVAIAPDLMTQIQERAAGNPFYVEELTNYLHERGIQLDHAEAIQTLELPTSLQSLITSRIDQLDEAQKTTLKIASVIGRVFHASWIWGSYPSVGNATNVKAHLEILNRLDITPLDQPEPELAYIFKHITTQEVAYESMTFALRAELHEAVARFIERTYPETPSYLNTLAFHYGRSSNHAKQRIYFRQAADSAKASFANANAIEYYQRLLPIVDEAERSAVLRNLGEVQQLIGQWKDAEANYRHAIELAHSYKDEHEVAATQTVLGRLLTQTTNPNDAIRELEEARQRYLALNDERGLIHVLEHLGFAYRQQAMYDQAIETIQLHCHLAETIQDTYRVCTALRNLGNVYFEQGNNEQAFVSLINALAIAQEYSYLRENIDVLNDLAGVLWSQSNKNQAFQYLQQALEMAIDIGYQQMIGYLIGNIGVLYDTNGDYDAALSCYLHDLRLNIALGSLTLLTRSMINVGSLLLYKQARSLALMYFETAIKLTEHLNIQYRQCSALYYAAFVGQDDLSVAISYCVQAITIAHTVERLDIEHQAQTLLVELQWRNNQISLEQAIIQLDNYMQQRSSPVQYANINYYRWRITQSNSDRIQAVESYRMLYATDQDDMYRQRLLELGEHDIPANPPFPDIYSHVLYQPLDPLELLTRAKEIINFQV